MDLTNFKLTLNNWGRNKVPFLFMIDFEMEKPQAWPLREINSDEVLFDINGFTNALPSIPDSKNQDFFFEIDNNTLSIEDYKQKFNQVVHHLHRGDSFLTNLTVKTKVETNRSLKELFYLSKARFKLWYKEQFLVFSPEIFIQIKNQKIFSFPMKGTIDASLPSAEKIILADQKELAEHVTIVDLIRNDLSLVADSVNVARFRYVEKVRTHQKDLLQVSSEIQGTLPEDYRSRIGDILIKLLPAGSVSGAPKKKTMDIVEVTEGEKRGYYTGVFGYFDGNNLDTGVMIRFIEKTEGQLYFRSGGGITTQSKMETEYQEAIDKIYVPIY
jgi:para-aminobenzoate synthetase component I